jgi:hypothetical protein
VIRALISISDRFRYFRYICDLCNFVINTAYNSLASPLVFHIGTRLNPHCTVSFGSGFKFDKTDKLLFFPHSSHIQVKMFKNVSFRYQYLANLERHTYFVDLF